MEISENKVRRNEMKFVTGKMLLTGYIIKKAKTN